MNTSHDQYLAQAFVELTNTLVDDFDVIEFLHLLTRRCVDLLGVQAAGIMVTDQRGALRVMASSSEEAHLLELFEVESDEGPCVDCFATGRAVAVADLETPDPRWRRFARRARAAGFRSVHAVPVRLRDETIGVLNLFAAAPGPLDAVTAGTARGLANVTTLGLLQHRAVEYRQVLAEQLQHAMNSRVVIEQAKGVLAERLGLDMAEAFDELRRCAVRIGRRLSDVAAAVVAGDYEPVSAGRDGRPRILLIRRFDRESLGALRIAVSDRAARHGMPESRIRALVLGVHEAAANAVSHGGGNGQLLLWLQGGAVYAEISDRGPGIPEGRRAEPAEPGTGAFETRGLWLINQVSADVQIDTSPAGTRLLLRHPLDSSRADSGEG